MNEVYYKIYTIWEKKKADNKRGSLTKPQFFGMRRKGASGKLLIVVPLKVHTHMKIFARNFPTNPVIFKQSSSLGCGSVSLVSRKGFIYCSALQLQKDF